ncbi:MAG: diaminopimelate epimerase [Planctomycetes bacterium]|nr:diaminopimelate epimerase [Planctomycetota bacterium]
MPFTKMHGLGNDYIYVDCFAQPLNGVDRPALSRVISDRHRGIGSDGLILICPPDQGVSADCRMEMYNADGSRGEMCGNGIRCVAKYILDHNVVRPASPTANEATVRIQTDRGVLELTAYRRNGRVDCVRVNMGPPILTPKEIPVAVDGAQCVRAPLKIGNETLTMTCVSMGNPHAVFFIDDFARINLRELGPAVEHHPLFPNRVNAHFVTVQSPTEATMKTWERGSGPTQACGTGACAVLVAGVLEDRLSRSALIHLPGGDLQIEWPDDEVKRAVNKVERASVPAIPDTVPNSPVFMTGPAEEVFSGEWRLTRDD